LRPLIDRGISFGLLDFRDFQIVWQVPGLFWKMFFGVFAIVRNCTIGVLE
jgi:hypothetical protein